MWLFTKRGFISAVRNRDDSRLVHIRAYYKGDLEKILKKSGISTKVTYTPEADYLCRADVTDEQWKTILVNEADTIDYENFKNAVRERDESRYQTYLAAHNVLAEESWSERQ